MTLKKYNDLPQNMKNDEVKKYYDILSKKKVNLFFKRIFDIIMSLILLILLSPVFLVLAIWIKLDSKGPVFYRQERITQYGRTFKIFKFRTMVQDADKQGSLITIGEDPRITKIGSKIRKCRLDEIPQLINILKGDMSFVGTRPEVPKYVEKYTNEMKATLLMPAGVTSIASIEFKNEDEVMQSFIKMEEKEKNILNITVSTNKKDDFESKNECRTSSGQERIDNIYINKILPEKMKLNLEYIEKFNIMQDIKLCLKTIFLRGKKT